MQNTSDPSCVLRLTDCSLGKFWNWGCYRDFFFFPGLLELQAAELCSNSVQWNHGDFYEQQGQMKLLFFIYFNMKFLSLLWRETSKIQQSMWQLYLAYFKAKQLSRQHCIAFLQETQVSGPKLHISRGLCRCGNLQHWSTKICQKVLNEKY